MRGYITGYDVANTIRMAHRQRRITFLVVEGEMDHNALRIFLIDEYAEIIVGHGRQNVLLCVSELDRSGESGFLALVDADFEHLHGGSPQSLNCIFTDYHDLEMVLLCSPALANVLLERASASKLSSLEAREGKPVLELLLERARPLGCLRLANYEMGYQLSFKDLDHSRFLDRNDLTFDLERLIDALVQRSETTATRGDLTAEVEERQHKQSDPRLLCSGHDVVAILGVALRRSIGSLPANQVTVASLERELRLAFDRACFERTEIYQAMRRWEQRNPGWPLLAPV